MPKSSFTVEIAYARPDKQKIISLKVASGTTAGQAILRSGILREFPDIDYPFCDIGIFSQLAVRDTPLQPGDRVELYRPLIADPKMARRQRAAATVTVDPPTA